MSQAPAATGPKPKKSVALSGVTAGNTALCTVGRTGNDLHYRGYDIMEFADSAQFEEIAHLLVHERLPERAELENFADAVREKRPLALAGGDEEHNVTALEAILASAAKGVTVKVA